MSQEAKQSDESGSRVSSVGPNIFFYYSRFRQATNITGPQMRPVDCRERLIVDECREQAPFDEYPTLNSGYEIEDP